MNKIILILLFSSLTVFGCNNEIQPYIPHLNPETERILEDFRKAIRQNQLKADSISQVYNINQEYGYTIPINANFDRYAVMNSIVNDFELFLFDIPYYGMCDSTKTKGFIFSLHFPQNVIEISIHSYKGEYSAYGDWYKYNVKFKN